MIKNIYNKYFKNSEYAKNVLTLMTGTTIAQAIPIAISPILTRLYSPDDFGLYALYLSIVSILSVVATGRYELAIMLPKKEKAAVHLLALSIGLAFIVSLIVFIIVLFFNPLITSLLENDKISVWLYFVPVSIFLTGCYNAFNYWFNRKKEYKQLAKSRVIQSTSMASSNLIFGFSKYSTGLIVSNIIGQFAIVLFFVNLIKKQKTEFVSFSKNKFSYLAKRYSNFPKFEMFSSFSNTASSQIPIILLTIFFGSSIVGLYSLSNRILSLPIGIFSSSISQVYLQKSVLYREKIQELQNLTFSTFKKLLLIGILPMSIITIFGDYLFSFIFGAKWEIAGLYSQILSIWLLLVFIASPLSTLLITLEKQKQSLIFNVSIFIARIVALLVGALIFESPLIAIILFAAVGVLFWLFFIIYILNLVKMNIIKVLFVLFVPLISVNVLLYMLRLLLENLL